jgi:hypothetical protein
MAANQTPDPTPAQPVKVQTPPEKGEQFGGFADRTDEAKTSESKDS